MTQYPTMRDEFLDECSHVFGFLTTTYGFSAPEVTEIGQSVIEASFYKGQIALVCSLDTRDEMVSFRVVRLVGGRKPSVWRVDERGEVVAEYLTALLIARGIRDLRPTGVLTPSDLSKRRAYFRKSLVREA